MLETLATAFIVSFGFILVFSVAWCVAKLWRPLLLLFVAWVCFGCGSDALRQRPGFRTIDGSDPQVEWALDTLDVFRNLVDVEPDRIDLSFVDTFEEQNAACQGFAACTRPLTNGYHITTFWPQEWSEVHPELLAHELCHVYYFQAGEGGDPTHSHIECFDQHTGFAAEVAMIVARDYGVAPPAGG